MIVHRCERELKRSFPSTMSYMHLHGKVVCYFGGARSKGFVTLSNVPKLTFFDKIGHVKSVGFRFYSAI